MYWLECLFPAPSPPLYYKLMELSTTSQWLAFSPPLPLAAPSQSHLFSCTSRCWMLFIKSALETKRPGVLSLSSSIDILAYRILCCGKCPVNYRVFRSIPNLYPLDATSTHSSCSNEKCCQALQMSPRGQNCILLRNSVLDLGSNSASAT